MVLKEYIKQWDEVVGLKPVNDKEFIKEFIMFMKSKEPDHYNFKGDNDYCGYTAILNEKEPRFSWVSCDTTDFEFAYGNDFVKVFTAKNDGYWVQEYIDLSGEAAQEILSILKYKLLQWAGFK